MSEQELRECPFVHGAEELPSSRLIQPAVEVRVGEGKFWGQCNRCGATGPWADTVAAAIAAWNQRGGEAELAKSQQDYAELSERVEQFRAEAEDVAEKREAELAALREDRDEAIGAALKVEQRCYDQAQEIKALRKLREACLGEWIRYEGGYDRGQTRNDTAIAMALAACDEASAPTGDEHIIMAGDLPPKEESSS